MGPGAPKNHTWSQEIIKHISHISNWISCCWHINHKIPAQVLLFDNSSLWKKPMYGGWCECSSHSACQYKTTWFIHSKNYDMYMSILRKYYSKGHTARKLTSRILGQETCITSHLWNWIWLQYASPPLNVQLISRQKQVGEDNKLETAEMGSFLAVPTCLLEWYGTSVQDGIIWDYCPQTCILRTLMTIRSYPTSQQTHGVVTTLPQR